MEKITGTAYLKLIESRLARYFDKKALVQDDLLFSLVAELNASDEGYFIIPSIKMYSVKHNEYLFIKHFDEPITMDKLTPYIELLRKRMQELKTTTEHMSSLFALVLICEQGIDNDLSKELESYKYHKDYCFSLKGWSDLALYIVDIPQQSMRCNKAGRKTAKYFEFVSPK